MKYEPRLSLKNIWLFYFLGGLFVRFRIFPRKSFLISLNMALQLIGNTMKMAPKPNIIRFPFTLNNCNGAQMY